ncbi:MAG: hypothetical protein JRG96_18290 [Deltaproteobacteria bacterium]|nr:hypothetical protein [Deltaproteobacteria bacterium]MBW2420510.1 hypothetical protein [Deltaproteobacteria bacterium]
MAILTDDSVFGPDSVIHDTVNDRDFLRLDFTTPYTYAEVQGELGAGGAFEGWQIASVVNLEGLGSSVGITHGSADPGQLALAEQLRDWFCPAATCVRTTTTHEYARGLVSKGLSGVGQLAFSIGRRFNVNPHELDFRLSGNGGVNSRGEQIYLTREAGPPIPEPSGALLFVLGSVVFGGATRRRARACGGRG